MGSWKRLACLACAVCTTLATAAPAQGDFHLNVSLPDADGYGASIWAEGHHQVGLLMRKETSAVTYTVQGRASSRRLDANFGALGTVHIHFRLRREPFSPALFRSTSCRAPRLRFFGGRFHGRVDFPGEAEVAAVSARAGRVSLVTYRRQGCATRGRESLREVNLFSAQARPEGRTTSLGLIRVAESGHGRPATLYRAGLVETAGRVKIRRSVVGTTGEEALSLGRRGAEPETAAIALPAPFTGSALYSVEAGTPPSWSGDLAVSFPGAAAVPLTGSEFRTGLCRSFSSGDPGRCTGSLAHLTPEEVGEFGR